MQVEQTLKKWRLIFLVASITLFIISLTQPAFYIDRDDYDAWSGSFSLLVFGWMGIPLFSVAAISWCANPCLFIAWFLIKKKTFASLIFALAAALLSLSFLFFQSLITDENGGYSKITHRCSGYWFWLSSCIFFSIGAFLLFRASKNQQVDKE